MLTLPLLTSSLVYAYSVGTGNIYGKPQTCDAINVCDGDDADAPCPRGMHHVAPPERSTVYTITATSSSYRHDELMGINIDTNAKFMQARRDAGEYQCFASLDAEELVATCKNPNQPGGVGTELPIYESAKWIGLLLYAEDATGKKVGGWEIPPVVPSIFWAPADPGCERHAIMHSDASPKDYHHELRWRAPAAGTGPVTFRALVKQGDTNGGAFYWPTATAMANPATQDLQLSESMQPTATSGWFRGTTSCDATCAGQGGKVCDGNALLASSSAAGLKTSVERFMTCRLPIVTSCDAGAPSFMNAEQFCSYRADATQCAMPNPATTASAACAATPAVEKMRLCPCMTNRRRRLLLDASTGPSNAAAPAASTPSLLLPVVTLLLAITFLGGDGNRDHGISSWGVAAATATLVFASLMPGSEAHNWVNQPSSRATEASTRKPCRARLEEAPNVQLNAGDEFYVEWSTGHASDAAEAQYHFWTIVRSEDEAKLALLDDSVLWDYINSAPDANPLPATAGGPLFAEGSYLAGARFEKLHYSWTDVENSMTPGTAQKSTAKIAASGLTIIQANDPVYGVQRPKPFACDDSSGRLNPSRHTLSPTGGEDCYSVDLILWKYNNNHLKDDRRASYKSDKYPWIISASAFKGVGLELTTQYDTTRLVIPTSAGPGSYVAHYMWSGYSDCVDVDVMPPSVVLPPINDPLGDFYRYGETSTTTTYSRIDHCQYNRATLDDVQKYFAPNVGDDVCYILAPPGEVNSDGETAEEAVLKCQARCEAMGSQDPDNADERRACQGINVVPIAAPPLVAAMPTHATQSGNIYGPTSTPLYGANIPYNVGNCQTQLYNAAPVGSTVCYPLRIAGDREVEEDWTISSRDVYDEVFYSTCYKRTQTRSFKGTSCPLDICPPKKLPIAWAFKDRCIACNDSAYNARRDVVPYWRIAEGDTCRVCGATETAIDAPPKPPASPGGATGGSWVSADGAVSLSWQASQSVTDAYDFTLECSACLTADSWVAVGINSIPQMTGTNAVRWHLATNVADEIVLNGKTPSLIVAAPSMNVKSFTGDVSTKTLQFTCSGIGEFPIATSGTQQFVYAYRDGGGFLYHDSKGFMKLNFDKAVDSAAVQEGAPEKTALDSGIVALIVGAIIACVILIVVATIAVLTLAHFIKVKRLDDAFIEGTEKGALGRKDSLSPKARQKPRATLQNPLPVVGKFASDNEQLPTYNEVVAGKKKKKKNASVKAVPPKPPKPL